MNPTRLTVWDVAWICFRVFLSTGAAEKEAKNVDADETMTTLSVVRAHCGWSTQPQDTKDMQRKK